MSASAWIKRRRKVLFEQQGGKCHWCKRDMISLQTNGVRREFHPLECTLDHLYHRSHPRRQQPLPGEQRTVAACFECNQRRGQLDELRAKRRAHA